jgi:hypothetical protein
MSERKNLATDYADFTEEEWETQNVGRNGNQPTRRASRAETT